MTGDAQLLLLDLDGVVVLECAAEPGASRQIVLLHDALPDRLQRLGILVAILTHRSRREAARILHAAGLDLRQLAGVFAAEDLFLSGLTLRSIRLMATRGLRKSLILPVLKRQLGIEPGNIVFVDDIGGNLDDLADEGLGLGLHAPSAVDESTSVITSFDFDDAMHLVDRWQSGIDSRRINLRPISIKQYDLRLTGVGTSRDGDHAFNRLRRIGTAVRERVFR